MLKDQLLLVPTACISVNVATGLVDILNIHSQLFLNINLIEGTLPLALESLSYNKFLITFVVVNHSDGLGGVDLGVDVNALVGDLGKHVLVEVMTSFRLGLLGA